MDAITLRRDLDERLEAAVSRKLGVNVSLVRWIVKSTGDIPVFRVPASLIERAIALGLTVDAA